jgi:iduronate 2-sulfatase
MDVYQAFAGKDDSYPDGLILREAIKQLDHLATTKKPFFLATGFIRPHLPFGAPAKYLKPYEKISLPPTPHPFKPQGKTTWHGSGEFMKYNRWQRDPNKDPEFAIMVRKHYAACITYVDSLIGQLLGKLEKLGLRKRTAVILWGDHGWHLGEHAIWGKHALFEESLRSPLIISYPGIPNPGVPSDSIVETLDLFPTICELAGLETPNHLDGKSLMPILQNPEASGHPAISYGKKGALTVRTKNHRLISHADGTFELYDHRTRDAETKNIASERPNLVRKLEEILQSTLNKNR